MYGVNAQIHNHNVYNYAINKLTVSLTVVTMDIAPFQDNVNNNNK